MVCPSAEGFGVYSIARVRIDDVQKRPWMYLVLSSAAATSARSEMRTPWKLAYFSAIPRRIWMVSNTLGSSTSTCTWHSMSALLLSSLPESASHWHARLALRLIQGSCSMDAVQQLQ